MTHVFQKVVTDLSTVPEPFHAFYQPGEAGYAMPDEVFAHLDNSGLRTALDKERKNLNPLKAQVEGWSKLGASPEEIQTKLTQLQEELAKKDGHVGQFEKFKTEMERAKTEALSAKDQELVRMRTTVENHLIVAEASQKLAELKGSPALLMPAIKSQTKVFAEGDKFVVRIIDSEGDPRYTANGNFMTIADLVSELKAHPEFGKAFEASGPSGSGMRPGATSHKPSSIPRGEMTSMQKISAGLAKL